jgi:carbonic anhydrase
MAQRDKLTPDEIIAHMKEGNQRFRVGKESPHDYLAQQKASAKGQYPAAVILSCIDSRAPAETIMDLGIGDCFNARVAGNVANDDIIGSMEFACKVAGAKVVLVMGHTACGAIKGAIDNVQLGNLTALLSKIRPAVSATEYRGERSTQNYELWMQWHARMSSSRWRASIAAVPFWRISKTRVRSRSSERCTIWKAAWSNSRLMLRMRLPQRAC